MALYDPDGIHVGDDADPHGHGFTLLAYAHRDDDIQGAVCLVPASRRASYERGSAARSTADGSGLWAGNYLTYEWDGTAFANVVAHWNLVDAVDRYRDELGGDY